jgi:hypothetical protein
VEKKDFHDLAFSGLLSSSLLLCTRNAERRKTQQRLTIIRFNKPEVGNRLSADDIAGLRAIEKQMSDTRSEATKDEIAVCAYFIWEQEGKPVGRALDHWLQAELQLAASLWHESLWHESLWHEEGRPSAAPH